MFDTGNDNRAASVLKFPRMAALMVKARINGQEKEHEEMFLLLLFIRESSQIPIHFTTNQIKASGQHRQTETNTDPTTCVYKY